MIPGPHDKTPTGEYLLHEFTERLAKNPVGKWAAVIHLSRLGPDYRGPQQLRIAANTFGEMLKSVNGQMVTLQQGDIVFLCAEAAVRPADEAIGKIRHLFSDDPIAAPSDTLENDRFATWYDLGIDYLKFAGVVDEHYKEEQRRQKRIAALTGDPRNERQPMDPLALNELVNTLARADVSNVLRRQEVCALMPGEPPKRVFREIYVSIGDLRDAIMPKRDITSDVWLFRYLTQTLDKRVLALLRKNDDSALAHSYSLNLNVSTVLSPEFQTFDANLRSGARGSIIIELEKLDIFADIGAFFFARDFARERGYRICIDGVTAMTLPFIDRDRLGLDLIKLFWDPRMADPERKRGADEVRAGIERIGKARFILARCDSAEAVQFGQSCGVHFFQGHHIDRLIAAAGPMTNVRLAPRQAAVAR